MVNAADLRGVRSQTLGLPRASTPPPHYLGVEFECARLYRRRR